MSLFPAFELSRPFSIQSLGENVRILIKLIRIALGNIDLLENFQTKLVTVECTGTTETRIGNPYASAVIPRFWFPVNVRNGGTCTLQRGPTAWTAQYLYFVNPSGGNISVDVMFFR